MAGVETRNAERESLFLMADVRLEGATQTERIKVRNLSPGGMMGEGDIAVSRGSRIVVALRNVGEIDGSVAWVQGNRFGVSFASEIDPKAPRTSVTKGNADLTSPRYARPLTTYEDPARLRKL
jgi:hypothetical protein